MQVRRLFQTNSCPECKQTCFLLRSVIDGDPLRFRGEVYHPYHFNCKGCNKELTSTAIEVKSRPGYTANELVSWIDFDSCFMTSLIVFLILQNELYCLRCHFKMGIPICGACRRPIEERVVTALGNYSSIHFHDMLILIKIWLCLCRETLVCGTFCVCQMRKTIFGQPALREERIGILWNSLPPVIR